MLEAACRNVVAGTKCRSFDYVAHGEAVSNFAQDDTSFGGEGLRDETSSFEAKF